MNAMQARGKTKLLVIAMGGIALAVGAIGWTARVVGTDREIASSSEPGAASAATEDVAAGVPDAERKPLAEKPPPSLAIDECNRYAAEARRNVGRVVGEAALGGALGSGVGAASGAIAGDHKSTKRGAGIGALVGATAGTLHGLNEENQRTEAARAAYADCMASRGYRS